jgi:hypothetical protein
MCEWDRAMVENDPEAIGRYMADDWTIIGPDGSVGDKAMFLGLVKSGVLTHDVMESHDMQVRALRRHSGRHRARRIWRKVPWASLPRSRTSILCVRPAGWSVEMCFEHLSLIPDK